MTAPVGLLRQADPMAMRSGRLEQVFGKRVEELTAPDIAALVASQVPEAFDLDYKATLYGRSDADKRALATDVAALANTAGGVIVIGVAEDEQARASELSPVEQSDSELGRIRQVVGSLAAPMPTFDAFLVPAETAGASPSGDEVPSASASTGFIVLAVPRSPGAPHAVLVNESLRYPRRNGATTRYLSEAEVADAYQARATGLAGRRQRLDDVWRVGLDRLDVQDIPTHLWDWATLARVPVEPLTGPRGTTGFDGALEHLAGHTGRRTAASAAKMLDYPTGHLDLAARGRSARRSVAAAVVRPKSAQRRSGSPT